MSGRRPRRVLRVAFQVPRVMFRLRLGWVFGGRLVLVEHVGRRSGRVYRTPLEVIDRDRAGVLTVASAFGGRADWYRNLVARPETRIAFGGRAIPATAEPMSAAEGSAAMLAYARRHRWLARRVLAVMGHRVDGTDAGFLEAGRQLRFVRLIPNV
ncbi:nitroreductase family deazaflavin-dependent oxidoreductase [Actinoplanes sp. TBRC 11911]|uniref:nitroreductase family deazaflavin-dependent oxidoreductase n=1 Tax=Actinoplanes sp. TBRC 11911 TaxID=2729386 RepID=UPI00145DB8E5|nr:nitroreductase family deazaflavin-dependent oxidoreductase [Actinoplanes sp. TBRC 11911]NMO54673.1 nitroreductase family deazaflavin-dependent oxidoreductase [Actinoplanes sp. TBRC 11911]